MKILFFFFNSKEFVFNLSRFNMRRFRKIYLFLLHWFFNYYFYYIFEFVFLRKLGILVTTIIYFNISLNYLSKIFYK